MLKTTAGLMCDVVDSVLMCSVKFPSLSSNSIDVYGDPNTGKSRVCCSQGRPLSWRILEGAEPMELVKRVAALKCPGEFEWHNGFEPKVPAAPA